GRHIDNRQTPKAADVQSLRIEINPGETVSALLIRPQHARACYVLAHGAGAGMTHSSMEAIAAGLGERGIATLRYQFSYMEKGSKRPMRPRWRTPPFGLRWRKPGDAVHRRR